MRVGAEYRVTGSDLGFRRAQQLGSGRTAMPERLLYLIALRVRVNRTARPITGVKGC